MIEIETLADLLAEHIWQELQADLDWLRDYEAVIPQKRDDGDEEIEDEELWTAQDQERERLCNR